MKRNAHAETARTVVFLAAALAAGWSQAGAAESPQTDGTGVSVREERVKIPTYEVGPPDPYPMFYDRRSYQGAQKRIYPYPLQDHLTHARKDKTYTVLRLENQYVRLSVLPELGGRIFSATDKTNGYDFFYRQHVIKPALIGMLGAWISGGVEWCVLHHHRATTFMPVDYTLEENPDGSKTIWVGEIERRHRIKWLIGITLRPGKSYVEAAVKIFNRTAQPHSFLYWANVAVHVDEQYRVIFPPSVRTATYHSKIDFTHWPISRGRYRGHDYSDVDVSWWKNSPVANSFFAWDLQEDFMGGYDHGKRAGVVHVANHHVVCGAKLWEWGTGTYGRAWDKVLTDEDGPYAELMVGAFSDNQPDYSWIKPYEVKTFKQYWYPVREIEGFCYANLHGALNIELKPDRTAFFGVHASSARPDARVILTVRDETTLVDRTLYIGPDRPLTGKVEVPKGIKRTDLRLYVRSAEGDELMAYQPVEQPPVDELPEKVKAPPKPEDVATIEELYLTGLRVEQIHNPSVDPVDYYREAVRRDPGDSRSNTRLAIGYNKRGMYAEAEKHLRAAIRRISHAYTRPVNTQAYYQLGLALRAQNRPHEAYDSFYRATWDSAFHSAAYYQLAELSCRKEDFAAALRQLDRSLSTNSLHTKALNLKAAVLRRLGRLAEAEAVAAAVLAIDPLDFWAMCELGLAQRARGKRQAADAALGRAKDKVQADVQTRLELAADYIGPGMWNEAVGVLRRPATHPPAVHPMQYYFLGYVYHQIGLPTAARKWFAAASELSSQYCFPFRLEAIDVFDAALAANPSDARAHYYLGNLLMDLQPDRAIEYWEKSRALDDKLTTVHRNLGWAYYRAKGDLGKAIECYERALKCERLDPRLFLDLDALYEFANVLPQRRMAALEANHDVVVKRQDSFAREITVLVLVGRYDRAIGYLEDNFFHAEEGREGIHDVYVDAHLLRGLELLDSGRAADALRHFRAAAEYPENLSVGRPQNDPRAAQVAYCTGKAQQALGNAVAAKQSYTAAAGQQGTSRWPQARFCQAMSLVNLDRKDEAAKIFDELIRTGDDRMSRGASADFFAKFGGQQTKKANTAQAHFIRGLGLLGSRQPEKAKQELQQAVKLNLSHVWAKYHLAE